MVQAIPTMTTLQIPDDVLQQAGITEREAVLALACRLFQTGRLSLFSAARLAGLPQSDFENVLLAQNIPLYHYTRDDLRNDMKTFETLRPPKSSGNSE